MIRLATYVDDELALKLTAAARANDRTLAAEVRRGLRLYVAMLDRRAAEPAALGALTGVPASAQSGHPPN